MNLEELVAASESEFWDKPTYAEEGEQLPQTAYTAAYEVIKRYVLTIIHAGSLLAYMADDDRIQQDKLADWPLEADTILGIQQQLVIAGTTQILLHSKQLGKEEKARRRRSAN